MAERKMTLANRILIQLDPICGETQCHYCIMRKIFGVNTWLEKCIRAQSIDGKWEWAVVNVAGAMWTTVPAQRNERNEFNRVGISFKIQVNHCKVALNDKSILN